MSLFIRVYGALKKVTQHMHCTVDDPLLVPHDTSSAAGVMLNEVFGISK